MKNKKLLLILSIILILIIIIYFKQRTIRNSNLSPNNISTETNKLWNDFNSNGVSFQYPKDLTTKYISIQQWPPTVEIKQEKYNCKETPKELNSVNEITTQKLVDNRVYCINVKYEGAAGSVYSSYNYTAYRNNRLISLSFVLRYPNCSNYDTIESKSCTSEREVFDLDGVIDRIIQSIKWDSSQHDIKQQLFECLPKSDTISHEKCTQLLSQIKTFDDCVFAGFSIMKSNPPQCATPDGRTFVEN